MVTWTANIPGLRRDLADAGGDAEISLSPTETIARSKSAGLRLSNHKSETKSNLTPSKQPFNGLPDSDKATGFQGGGPFELLAIS